MTSEEDPGEKFDKFIRNFDEKLHTDTSTINTISRKPSMAFEDSSKGAGNSDSTQSPIKQSTASSGKVTSTLLATPTKPSRNTIPLDSQPLSSIQPEENTLAPGASHKRTVSNDGSVRQLRLIDRKLDVSPQEVFTTPGAGGSLKRSNTMSSVRLGGSKRGLNLGLSINKQTPVARPSPSVSMRSPETPSHNALYGEQSTRFERSRRRTNSSLSSHSSITLDLKSNDFNDSLRELALKEMKIIELKDQMKILQRRIEKEEEDLNQLKMKVGNDYRESLSPAQSNQSTPPVSNNNSNNTRVAPSQHRSPLRDTPESAKSQADNGTKRQSVWSKPINFLNQFDQILQNEIEKLNREAFPSPQPNRKAADVLGEQYETVQEEAEENYPGKDKGDDVLNTVSNSLWSFVSDVKHGLLGDDYSNSTTSQQKYDGPTQTTYHPHTSGTLIDMTNDNEQEMVSIHKSK